jgi:hypothetical protein
MRMLLVGLTSKINLLLADFDPAAHHIVAQPFMLRAEVDGQVRGHTLDYLWDADDGPVVVDVVRAQRAIHSSVAYLCAGRERLSNRWAGPIGLSVGRRGAVGERALSCGLSPRMVAQPGRAT